MKSTSETKHQNVIVDVITTVPQNCHPLYDIVRRPRADYGSGHVIFVSRQMDTEPN